MTRKLSKEEIERKIRLRSPQFKTEEEKAVLRAELRESYRKHFPHNTMEEKEAVFGIEANGKYYHW